jgi:hypothetical protein
MKEVRRYYEATAGDCARLALRLQKKMHRLGNARLFLVVAAGATVWLLREQSWKPIAGALAVYAALFALLMVYHTRLAWKKTYAETRAGLCANELKGLDYDFSPFDGAPDKINEAHPFSLDLDLFGERSFFQSLNRTVTRMGRERLAGWFADPLTEKEAILQRREAVKELAPLVELRQDFYIRGLLQPGKPEDARLLDGLASGASVYFAGSLFWRTAVWLLPLLWAMAAAGLILGYLPFSVCNILFALSFPTAYVRLKQVNELHKTVERLEKILLAYSQLMAIIEKQPFTSRILAGAGRQLVCKGVTASQAISKLSSHTGVLDQRGTLTGVLLNIFSLRHIRASIAIENWKKEYGTKTGAWFDSLACFDALSSLAGFAFNHPDYIYPAIADSYFEASGRSLGHPLLRRDVCVKNDVSIPHPPYFLIITGANMAGKSTYLRTVGINFLLATVGAPVCAAQLSVYPAQLVTSLRTSDSLTGNESYFFAELKRLKMIIDRLHKGEKLFIILDEILKGTNSVDKQQGSFALVKQLLRSNACGIIATHDLTLGSLQGRFPSQIKNYRFEAGMIDDTLSFSYQLKEGVAQNMNACFLMQKMGISIEDV